MSVIAHAIQNSVKLYGTGENLIYLQFCILIIFYITFMCKSDTLYVKLQIDFYNYQMHCICI